MTHEVDRARGWYGIDALGPVWDELARRMGASDRPVRRIKIDGLDNDGRRALASLFGHPRVSTEARISISTAKLAEQLGLDDSGLRTLVERLRGPIENRAAARDADRQAREVLWRRAEARLGATIPRTLTRIRSAGVPEGDVGAQAEVIERLALAIDRIPLSEPLPLPMFAWDAFGDPHALDVVVPSGRHLEAAAVELAGPDPTGSTRRAMAKLGVVADRLSTTTLTFGVRARPDSPLGLLLEAAAAVSLPISISGAMLDAGTPVFTQRRWLCVENPSIVEACTLGGFDVPIVCTSGWPSNDTRLLFSLAVCQGIELIHAADYDEYGLDMASRMIEHFGATIAMSADVYLRADHKRAPPWSGRIPRTPWDEELARAIENERRVVYQEDPVVWHELVRGIEWT